MSGRDVILVELGAGPLPDVSPVPLVPAAWVPAPYTPPPLPVPSGLQVEPTTEGLRLTWIRVALKGAQTIVEVAEDDDGEPSAWERATVTADARYVLPMQVGARWVRLRTLAKNGLTSEAGPATLASTDYVPLSQQDVINTGGINRIGVAINDPLHQIGGALNYSAGGFANFGAAWLSDIITSYTASPGVGGGPASATISVSGGTLRMQGTDIVYNATSVEVQGVSGTSVTYHLYIDDAQWQGGTRTLATTTDIREVQNYRGRIYMGYCTVAYPAEGLPPGTGGGHNPCSVVESHLPCGRRAGGIHAHALLSLCEPWTRTERVGHATHARTVRAPCVRVQFENGVWLACSTAAALPLSKPGHWIHAVQAFGHHVLTKRLRWRWLRMLPGWLTALWPWCWRYEWSQCTSAADIGLRDVREISADNACYWVGGQAGGYVLHHNLKALEPEFLP